MAVLWRGGYKSLSVSELWTYILLLSVGTEAALAAANVPAIKLLPTGEVGMVAQALAQVRVRRNDETSFAEALVVKVAEEGGQLAKLLQFFVISHGDGVSVRFKVPLFILDRGG